MNIPSINEKDRPFKVVFMGTPLFAAHVLQKLVEAGINIVGVVTTTDKPAYRGLKLTPSPVKKLALEHELKLLQPETLSDSIFIAELEDLKPDLQVVVAFRKLPEIVWNLPPKGTINLHASLLPQYRGAAPINHAIINGEKESGVTTFFINNEIDTGNILFMEKIELEKEETAGSLHNKLMVIGAELVLKTINAIQKGTAKAVPQTTLPADQLKKAPKISKTFCKIDWNIPAEKVLNFIKGVSPFPTAFCDFYDMNGTAVICKIFKARSSNSFQLRPAETYSDNKTFLKVGTQTGDIEILEIQQEGKKYLKIEEFLRGNKKIIFNN
ncbi:MAG: methionyl-tRNA formyltransferase [Marinilabiliaceae bacterium]|nr:methionyl-tRNA formyltransferase [Marinilabiliaceae bacterium]